MSQDRLHQQIASLLESWENECVEFKDANDNFSTSEIGKYFSALSNEANLRGRESAWLVFGVDNKTRKVIGTTYRENTERLHSLKHQIAQGTDPSVTFKEIYELTTTNGRVVLFDIPAAPRGIPIAWNGHYHARQGESLAALDLAKLDAIRAQGAAEDWSAVICPNATVDDLDPVAVAKARDIFLAKYGDRIPEETIRSWSDAMFLDQAKLTTKGRITRATLLLLGRTQSTHFLSPYVAELSWKLEGPELDYEHFHPPFLLETSRLFQRIRNLRLPPLLPPGQLIPVDISKYDQRIVLEALHNCIAHQDYRQCERVLVIERVGELEFQNAGNFFDGKPDDYILGNRTPSRYRNRYLAEAMATLRMIDTMGFGIREVMFRGQARRYLPLPDYDLSDPGHVVMRLAGRFIDENYSRALLAHGEFTLGDILALDRVQKGFSPDAATLKSLRKRGLVEGRKPALHVSASVAEAADHKVDYIRTRRQDDAHYRKLILDYIAQWKQANTLEIRDLLMTKLPDNLDQPQKENKVRNLLAMLRKEEKIRNLGSRRYPRWVLANN